nr:hypothetical protein JVH1_3176 [Rhodococcus sp. JVH1]
MGVRRGQESDVDARTGAERDRRVRRGVIVHAALAGVVRSTWLAGKRIDLDEAPRGRLLSRGLA